MRTIGKCCQPSARALPISTGSPRPAAVSREVRYPVKMPRSTSLVRIAGTPSSSHPNVPMPPGTVASAVIDTCGLP